MSASPEWRRVLRAARAGRNAAWLGPRAAAYAAAAELLGAESSVRIATAAVLASQGAKNEFIADLDALWRELEADDPFRAELIASRSPIVRRPPSRRGRRDPLPVEAARAVSILHLFERYGHQIRRAGVQWVTRCPFHEDQRPSLTLSSAKGLWYCHPCGIGGDAIAYMMRRKGIDFTDAVREVAA
jgi:hypothetical protein